MKTVKVTFVNGDTIVTRAASVKITAKKMKQIIKFTNGWFAEYAGNGRWLLIDNTPEETIQGVSYLDSLMERFKLVRVSVT